MSLVLDASPTVAWYFDGEGTAATDAVLDQVSIGGAMTPAVSPLEVANALLMAVRRNRSDAAYRNAALAELALLPIGIDTDTGSYDWRTTVRLAERFDLTLYDASYLELAQRRAAACHLRRSTGRSARRPKPCKSACSVKRAAKKGVACDRLHRLSAPGT